MLLIDAGNTVVKCRVLDDEKFSDYRFTLNGTDKDDSENFRALLTDLADSRVYLASVAGELVVQQIERLISEVLPRTTMTRLVTLPSLGAVKNAYGENYAQLGVDRWLTLLAAHDMASTDVIVIDAGSAITIDLLSQDEGHLGGAILAGVRTDSSRFRQIFSRLDFTSPDIKHVQDPGRTTLECIHLTDGLDVVNYSLSLMELWVERLSLPVEILLCGHDADKISPLLKQKYQVVPDLVFRGMLKQIQLQG